MSNPPERIWIEDEFGEGDDDQWTYGTWDERNYRGYDVEYVRADTVQSQIDAAREGVLQEAALAVKECLIDESLPLTSHGVELNAVVYECHSAILALIRKGDQP